MSEMNDILVDLTIQNNTYAVHDAAWKDTLGDSAMSDPIVSALNIWGLVK